MTAYPGGVYSPRTKENKSGVVYDADKETVGFAEDITKLDDEVVAIETELGANPSGESDDVADRLDDIDTDIDDKQDELDFGFETSQVTALLQKSAIKTYDETVNNSAVLQDDNHLKITASAWEMWILDVTIFYDTGTIPDIKFAFTGPSGASAVWSFIDADPNVVQAIGGSASRIGGGAGNKRACHIKGWFFVQDTAGDITLQWAQNTANASNTKVLLGSNIIATRVG